MSEEAIKKIETLRKDIDVIDRDIVEMLNKRAGIALEIRKLKADNSLQLYDPGREEEIFRKITAVNNGPLYDDDLRGIYETILQTMKSMD